ncbi:MAG TPA: hypothetical protein VGD56_09935 [Gemmatirosa sp.]
MPSATFTRFLAQLRAQGREKADGFDRSHFDGLAPDERPEVARLLEDALARGDNTAVGGLLLLDPSDAPTVLRDALARLPFENTARVTIAGALLARSDDPALQRELVRYLSHPVGPTRRLALNYLTRSAPNRALAPALQQYVHDEAEGDNRALGAELALYWSGAISRLDDSYRQYGSLLNALEEGNVFARRRALGDFDRAVADAARGQPG